MVLFEIKSVLLFKKNKNKNDSKAVYNKEFLKTKIKPHGNEVTDFYNKKIPKVDFNHIC